MPTRQPTDVMLLSGRGSSSRDTRQYRPRCRFGKPTPWIASQLIRHVRTLREVLAAALGHQWDARAEYLRNQGLARARWDLVSRGRVREDLGPGALALQGRELRETPVGLLERAEARTDLGGAS